MEGQCNMWKEKYEGIKHYDYALKYECMKNNTLLSLIFLLPYDNKFYLLLLLKEGDRKKQIRKQN